MSSFIIRERHSAGSPSGPYTDAGEGFGFVLIGQLGADLAAGTAIPTTSVTLTPNPSTQARLEAVFTDNPALVDLGKNLLNIIMVGEEFMLATSAAVSGPNVVLSGVYRGVLDTAQSKHTAGTNVYVVYAGGVLTDSVFDETHNVDVLLLPHSISDTVAEGDATPISFNMDKRLRRPYPPASTDVNGSGPFPASNSLDFASGGPELTGMEFELLRRDYRLGNAANDEVAGLLTDAETLYPDYPAANSTTHTIAVRNDPEGTDTLLFTIPAFSGRDATVRRIVILRYTDGVVPTRMRIEVASQHDEGADVGLESRYPLTYDFDTASAALAGQHNFGARLPTVASTVYTATDAGTYNFTLSSAATTGDVEYRLNGGTWTTLIVAGLTTGMILGVSVSDTIEVRHGIVDTGALKQLDMVAPGSGQDAYAILYV
jgi:hypothetical protein